MDARGTLKMNSLGWRGKRKGRPEDRWRSLRRTTTARGLGRRSVRRHDSRFETLYRHCVSTRAYLESKIGRRAGNDVESAGIRWSEGQPVSLKT